jgi:carbon starvation protein
MAFIFSAIPMLKNLMAYWYQFALMFEALFILTTIDAGTRVARYLVQELGGYVYKPFGNLSSITGNLVASFLVVLTWGYFIYTGSISIIWPIFGTANQLLGMLALCIGTTFLIKMKKIKYSWVTLIPMLFMAVTTFSATFMLLKDFSAKALSSLPDAFNYKVDAILVGIMLCLALLIVIDSVIKWCRFFLSEKLMVTTETIEQ